MWVIPPNKLVAKITTQPTGSSGKNYPYCAKKWVIVGYVTSARPPTSRALLVGESKCAPQASARSQPTSNIK
jgi:hypothetical protein